MAKKEEQLASLVQERYQSASRNQMEVFQEMEECRLFFRGDQWLRYRNGKWDTPPPSASWRVRLVVNKLAPLVELLVSTFMRNRPIIIATPASDESADRKAAKVAQILLRYFWNALEFDDKLIDALTKTFIYGSSFLRVSWDPEKGRKFPVVDPIAQMPTGAKPEGSPWVDVISPFSFSVEPGATSLDDAAWCITTELLRIDSLRRKFNTDDIEPESGVDEYGHIPIMVERDITSELKDRVALHMMYERPTKKHENGRLVYVANNKVLHKEELPNGEIRIVHLKGIILPDEFWPTSVVSQVLPLQMELNRGRSQLIENRNLCSRPVVLCPEGAMAPGAMKAKPGHVAFWDPMLAHGAKPEYMTPPHVPQWVTYILEASNQDIMDLASRHEVSQGIQSSAVTSGRQAAIFRAADDSRLAPALRSFEVALQKIGQYILSECKEHMKGEQIIPIVGRGREGEVAKFQATDISDKANIVYEVASQLPWSRESMRQQLMHLNQMGKIDDETLMERLELPTVQSLYEHEQEHRLNARLENDVLGGMKVNPLPTDNHQIHLQEHERWVNQPENRRMFIEEMRQQQEYQQMQQQLGEEAEEESPIPPSLQNYMEHMEAHRKEIPPPAPPPPAAKVNMSLDRVLQNPILQQNPQLAQEILQIVLELGKDAVGQVSTPSSPPTGQGAQPRAPGAAPPGQPTPPGSDSAATPAVPGLTEYEQEMRSGGA